MRYVVNDDVAEVATGAKSVYWGDFTYYRVFDAQDLRFFRFTDSAYSKKGVVGFMAEMRTAGKLVTAGTPIKHLAQA